jgi:hypothetical protein
LERLRVNARGNLTYAQLQAQLGQLETQGAVLLERAEAADQSGETGGELPEELAEAQPSRARLLAAKAQLAQQTLARHQQREEERDPAPPDGKRSRLEPQPKAQDRINLTDADSSLTRRGKANPATRFRLRGLAKVRIEWILVSVALNCRRGTLRWNGKALESTIRLRLPRAPPKPNARRIQRAHPARPSTRFHT